MFGSVFGKKKSSELDEFVLMGKGVDMDDPTRLIDITLPDSYRKGHMVVFGATRSGKSKLAEACIEQDMRAGRSVILLDPKPDLQLMTKIIQTAISLGREDELMLVTPVSEIEYYFAQERRGSVLSDNFFTTKERVEFFAVGLKTSFVSGMVSALFSPVAIGVLEKMIPVFGSTEPTSWDKFFIFLLALGYQHHTNHTCIDPGQPPDKCESLPQGHRSAPATTFLPTIS